MRCRDRELLRYGAEPTASRPSNAAASSGGLKSGPATGRSPARAGARAAPRSRRPRPPPRCRASSAERGDGAHDRLRRPALVRWRAGTSGRSSACRSAAGAGRRGSSSRCRSRRSRSARRARRCGAASPVLLEVRHQHALGDLELEAAAVEPVRVAARRVSLSTKASPCASSARRHVDREPAAAPGSSRCQAPACDSARSSVHSPIARIRPHVLGERHEFLRAEQAARRVLPAHQRLGADHRAPCPRARTGCQCSTSSLRASAPRSSFSRRRRSAARAFSAGVEEAEGAAPALLRVVHARRRRCLQELGEVAPVARIEAMPIEAPTVSVRPSMRERPRRASPSSRSRERRRLLARLEAVPEQHELVAAQARRACRRGAARSAGAPPPRAAARRPPRGRASRSPA